MSQQAVQIELPDQLYERIRKVAESSHRSVEAVALEALEMQFVGTESLLETSDAVLASYTDDQLWAVVDQRLTRSEQLRLRRLLAAGKDGVLNGDNEAELNRLLKKVDAQMLERSRALVLLQERGYDIKHYLKSGKR